MENADASLNKSTASVWRRWRRADRRTFRGRGGWEWKMPAGKTIHDQQLTASINHGVLDITMPPTPSSTAKETMKKK